MFSAGEGRRWLSAPQVVATAVILSAGAAAKADFTYSNFDSTAGLVLNGAAATSAPASPASLLITPAVGSSAGSVWTSMRQGVGGSFTADFTFRINVLHSGADGADGFAFVIQNAGTSAIGDTGAGIGYATNPQFVGVGGIPDSLAIEFDTFNNNDIFSDFNSNNHVSIQTAGLAPNRPDAGHSLGAAVVTPNMSDGNVHAARISYTAGVLRVYVDDLSTPIVTASVNVQTLLNVGNGTAYVGFTAGTGGAGGAESHEILSASYVGVAPAPGCAVGMTLGVMMLGRRRR